jgi:xylan 1,4-beta-xylosidase
VIGAERLSQLDHGVGAAGRHIGDEFAEALRLAHDELGVEAVRAHAILHDDLGVYREVGGQPHHDFTNIDRIYDRVVDLGLRPIVEISFMPRDLASDPDRTVFEYGAIVSPPKDWTRWEQLVGDLAAHLVERYGRDEVRSWGFEVWNEANLEVFWSGTRDDYLRLYDVSSRAVKAVDAALPVGGPASAAAAWIDELLVHVDRSSAPIDFLSTHTYGNAPLDLRPIAARHGRPDLRLWWTEWGAHATHFNRAHDSVWSAAYLTRGMVSAMGRLDALAYWTISDHFEELGRAEKLLHGGFGLLSIGNLRKPRWWALWMLEQLGDQRLDVVVDGDGAGDMVNAVASIDSDATLAIVVWNGTVDVTKSGGDQRLDRDVEVTVTDLAAAAYRVRHRRVDEDHSNLNATWSRVSAGRPWPDDAGWRTLIAEDHLADVVPPRDVEPVNGSIHLQFALPMPAVSLIELVPA